MLGMVISVMLAVTPLGTYGNTYSIKEKDAMVEIEEKIKKVDVEKIRKELEAKMRNYKPSDLVSLPQASKSFTYLVDMTYTLDTDIPKVGADGKMQGILYPKGYSFNPLEYMPADPPPLVIFNGTNTKEREWVKKKLKENDPIINKSMFLATQGDFIKLANEFKRPVYYLKEIMAERLQLKNTISIVYREKNRMRVDVHSVQAKKSGQN